MEISLWHQCLRRLEAELPEQSFNTWIRPLQAVEDDGRLRLLAPNRYVVDWVNQNCAGRIGELLDELVPAPAPELVVEIGSRRLQVPIPAPAKLTEGIDFPVQPRGRVHPAPAFGARDAATPRRADPVPQFGGRLNPDFTFDSFVEGKSNQLARAAALQVARESGPRLQPVVHLRRRRPRQDAPDACGRQPDPGPRTRSARVAYVHSERFVERHGPRAAAQHDQRLQADVSHARRTVDRRHPVLRGQGTFAGGVLPHVQCAAGRTAADHPDLRPLSEGSGRASRSA